MSKISPGVLSPPREVLTPDEWRARGRARRERAWDLGHMATPDLRVSFAVASRGNGLKEGAGSAAARRCVSSQPAEMARFASKRFLNVRYSRIDARESVAAPFGGPSEYEHHGERVAGGQRIIQAATDEFPGWTRGVGTTRAVSKDYYVRQLRDRTDSMDVPATNRDQLTNYAGLGGSALARGHARTGRATLVSGYLGPDSEFDRAIAQFSVACTEQNEKDYHALVDAVATGRIQAVTGLLTANQRPRLTGPLLPCARARPGTAAGACYRWTSTAPTPRFEPCRASRADRLADHEISSARLPGGGCRDEPPRGS